MLGWQLAKRGFSEDAFRAYLIAEYVAPYVWGETEPPARFGAHVSLLRHCIGKPEGDFTKAFPPTEWGVVTQYTPDFSSVTLADSTDGLDPITLDPNTLARNIGKLISEFAPGIHRKNITEDREHVMVMSTGRCGTVSLYRLFVASNLTSHHTYWWHVSLPLH